MSKLIVTGPYTAYLAACAARRAHAVQCKRDARSLRMLGMAQINPEIAPPGHIAALAAEVDRNFYATKRAWTRMIEAGNDLEWERFFMLDWEPEIELTF